MKFEEVLAAAENGPVELSSLLDRREAEITPELAAAADELSREGKLNSDGDKAFIGSAIARDLYLRLGDETNALRALITANEVFYVSRNTTEDYLKVHGTMIDAVRQADEIGSSELAFHAAVLATEAGFHAGEGAGQSDEWRLAVLASIATARGVAPTDPTDGWYQRLIYMIAVAGSEAMMSISAEEGGQLTQALRELASWVDESVPDDFEFDLDAKVNAQIAGQLTALSTRFA